MKVVALGGAPGVGKSTVVKRVIAELEAQGFARLDTRASVKRAERTVSVDAVELCRVQPGAPVEHVLVLGRYDAEDAFPGTDRLSMAVQPVAEDLIADLAAHAARTGERVAVLFEGDRLFSRSFLLTCAATPGVEVRVAVLHAAPEQLEARRAGRGSNQSASWAKGRDTKVERVVHWLEDSGETVHHLDNGAGGEYECSQRVLELLAY